jgi:hemerythrin-like domain-containing protein
MEPHIDRRVAIGAVFAVSAAACSRAASRECAAVDDVMPVEDLMREHGVLRRVLLVYEECARRLEIGEALSADPITAGADIMRRFVEDYHARLEEERIFPRFEKAHVEVSLVSTLRVQHTLARRFTDELAATTTSSLRDESNVNKVVSRLRLFRKMMDAHAAREDTVLFPALRRLMSANEYAAMGEDFENEEHRRFGMDGFREIVGQVAGIERDLGIAELDALTPA